jgi:NAD(P)-dependent dehydrogenase (short-subunit alcohol dehydrogenase family)
MDLGLKGKRAIVAGATRGIGLSTARVLAAEGAEVFALARDAAALARLTAELGGGHAVADLTDTAETEAGVAAAVRHFGGPPDILIVSAGAAQGGLFLQLDDATWHAALELKFMGMVRLFRAVAPLMVAGGRGRIVAIVGNNGKQPSARMGPGAAANAACLAAISALAEEVAGKGISVTALNPGPTRTDRWATLIERLAAQEGRPAAEVEAERLAAMPRGRIGEPDEMARLAAILASDLADMVTGTSLTADGGATRALA